MLISSLLLLLLIYLQQNLKIVKGYFRKTIVFGEALIHSVRLERVSCFFPFVVWHTRNYASEVDNRPSDQLKPKSTCGETKHIVFHYLPSSHSNLHKCHNNPILHISFVSFCNDGLSFFKVCKLTVSK